jgi:FtsZ-interacting cell division protein ZipA
MIRYVIIVIAIYLIYVILKTYFSKRKTGVNFFNRKSERIYNPGDIEDAEFKEVNNSDDQGDKT